MLRGARRRSRSSLRRYTPLRGGARRPARLPQSPVRRLGGRYPGLHIFVHARLPAIESREEEDVLGTVGIEVQVVVRARRRRWTGGRIVRLLQRLRRRKPLVGPDTGKPLHAESRLGAVQVRRVDLVSCELAAVRKYDLAIVITGEEGIRTRIEPRLDERCE